MLKFIDSLSYSNRLSYVTPVAKAGTALVLVLLAYLGGPFVQTVIILWLARLVTRHAGIPMRAYGLMLGSACTFYMISLPALIIEVLNSHTAAIAGSMTLITLFHWKLIVTHDGIITAGTLLLRAMACASCFLFLILTTPVPHLFHVLKQCKVPFIVLEIMQVMYRFLFLLLQTAEELYIAQRARGGQQGIRRRLADTALLAGKLFSRTMQRYRGFQSGLMARGFVDTIPLPSMARLSAMPKALRNELIFGGCILAIAAFMGLGGYAI